MTENSLHKKLDYFRGGLMSGHEVSPETELTATSLQMAQALGGAAVSTDSGAFCLITNRYPLDGGSRGRPLVSEEPTGPSTVPVAAFVKEDDPGRLSLESLRFIDTETTGLGGAGTVAFVVGCGSVKGDEFEIRQYLMPDYSDEAAMLEALLDEFGPSNPIVSYNGATFDLPVLRDRLIINRVGREIAMARHVDLLHAVRRLFRRRLRNCSLVNVERELLGFERTDDIPGYLIPSVYFEWLAEQNPNLMSMVLRHNRRDILSLYHLTVLIARAYESQGETLDEVDDLYSLSRILFGHRQHARVIDLYQRLDALQAEPLPDDVLYFHALAFKRAGQYHRAIGLWEQLSVATSREAFWANVELAKYHEHQTRDLNLAHQYARRAAEIKTSSRRQTLLLQHRLARLERRLPP